MTAAVEARMILVMVVNPVISVGFGVTTVASRSLSVFSHSQIKDAVSGETRLQE
jgi:hypothetical protein